MRARAYAKINLALAVYRGSADGYHPLSGIFQSVSLFDDVSVTPSSRDAVTVSGGEAPADETNLAWKALEVARRASRVSQSFSLDLVKRIPSGSGLGGGSADAAATLGLFARRFRIDQETVNGIAESLGSDVPFSLHGGTKLVEGRGERMREYDELGDFALGIVVPPFSLSTPEVFREWDRLGGPIGEEVDDKYLPTSLRGGLPIRNDLLPAALSLEPRLGEWRDELSKKWGTAVAMTGSGSALFAFFGSLDETEDALSSIEMATRAAEAVVPVSRGWESLDDDIR